MRKMKLIYALSFVALMAITSCKTIPNQNIGTPGQGQRPGQRQAPPTVDQLFAEMDTNKDNKLSKEEVKGPLANDFSKIDTNKDDFISREEMNKAPKPQQGNRRG